MYPCNIHFAFPSYFGFTKSYQNSCITVLPISSIDKPILTSLFMNFCVFSISIANKFPENFFCVMKVWFKNQISLPSLGCYKLDNSMTSYIFRSFFKKRQGSST